MRVALAPEGTRGDVQPLLELGAWLREHGHAVRVCAPPDFAETVRARGLEHHPVGRDVREELRRQAPAIVRGGLAMARAADRFLREALSEQFRDLGEGLRGCDRVIGAGVQLAAPSWAERLGLPYRYVVYCPALLPSAEHPPFVLERQDRSRRINRLAWWALRRGLSLAVKGRVDRERARLGLPPLDDLYRHMCTGRPVLASDPVLGDPPADAAFPVDRVGCLHPDVGGGGALPPKLEAFLEQGPPPVYVGFGSMTDPDARATTRLVVEAARRAGCRLVVSRGWAGLGEGPLPEGVLAVGSVDHGALFPRVAAVVHHGGAGTTTTSVRAGVPQVVVPHVLDQFYWAHRAHALGVAPPGLTRRRLTADGLAAALAGALEDEGMAERAAALAERVRRARPPRSSWARLLEAPLPSG